MKNYIKYIIVFACLLLFGFIAVNVYLDNEFYFDEVIYDFVSDYFISDGITPYVKFITWFGSAIGIIVMGIFSLFIFRDKKISISMIICLVVGIIINNIFKVIFARVRPDINPLVVENSYSFPSGHSMMSMIFYGYLIYLIYNNLENKKIKFMLIFVLSVLILCIGFTRIYLGVHYVSDVIGGFLLGFAYMVIYANVANKAI